MVRTILIVSVLATLSACGSAGEKTETDLTAVPATFDDALQALAQSENEALINMSDEIAQVVAARLAPYKERPPHDYGVCTRKKELKELVQTADRARPSVANTTDAIRARTAACETPESCPSAGPLMGELLDIQSTLQTVLGQAYALEQFDSDDANLDALKAVSQALLDNIAEIAATLDNGAVETQARQSNLAELSGLLRNIRLPIAGAGATGDRIADQIAADAHSLTISADIFSDVELDLGDTGDSTALQTALKEAFFGATLAYNRLVNGVSAHVSAQAICTTESITPLSEMSLALSEAIDAIDACVNRGACRLTQPETDEVALDPGDWRGRIENTASDLL